MQKLKNAGANTGTTSSAGILPAPTHGASGATVRDDAAAAIELSLSEGGAPVDLVGGSAEGNALYSRCTTVRDEPGNCTRYTGPGWCVVLHRD